MSHKGRCFRDKRRTVARKKRQAERKRLREAFAGKFYKAPSWQQKEMLMKINLAALGY